MFCIFTFESLVKQCKCNATRGFSLFSKGIKGICIFTVLCIYVTVLVFVYKAFLLIISWAKLLQKLVKALYCKLSFQITCILPNLSMSDVILKQLLQVFSSSLSLVQIKDKMVLSCLKLKQNSFKLLKQSMFTFTTKTF